MKIRVAVKIQSKSNHLSPEFILRETAHGFEFGWRFNGKRIEKVETRIEDLPGAIYKANRYLTDFGLDHKIDFSSVQKELISQII